MFNDKIAYENNSQSIPKTNISRKTIKSKRFIYWGVLWLYVICGVTQFKGSGYQQDASKEQRKKDIEISEQYENDKMWGNAIIEILKRSNEYASDVQMINRVEELRKKIINRLQLNICLLPDNKDYQEEVNVTQKSYSLILSRVPDVLNFIYWENIKDAFPALVKSLESGSKKEGANLRGIDQVVFIKLVNSEIRKQSIERAMTQVYIKDSFKKENPEWERLQIELDQLKKRLQEKKEMQKWSSSTGDSLTRLQSSIMRGNAESDLYRALWQLLAESRFTVEKVFEFWPYKVITKRSQGVLAVNYRIIDFYSTEIISTSSFKKIISVEDDTIENPNPYIGVIDDPLNLPSDEELREDGFDELLQDIAKKIISDIIIQESKKQYFEAKQFEMSNLYDKAAEKFINYLFLSRIANTYFDKNAKDFMLKRKGFDIELLKPVVEKQHP